MRSLLYLGALFALPAATRSSPFSYADCRDADIPLEIPSSSLDPSSSAPANLTVRERHVRGFNTVARVNVKEDGSAKDITLDYDIRFTSEELKSAISVTVDDTTDENTVSLIVDGKDYHDPRWPRECLVTITTVTIPKSLSHLIFDIDNAGLNFYRVSSNFGKLDVFSHNGHVAWKDASSPSIKELGIQVLNGAVFTASDSELKTTKSAAVKSKNGAIRARVSGPSLNAQTQNGAIHLLVPDSVSESSESSERNTIAISSSNGAIGLAVLAPSAPVSISATSRAGSVSTTLYSPAKPGTFHVETEVGSAKAEGNLKVTKAKHGLIGGLLEGYWGPSEDVDPASASKVELSSTVGSARFCVSDTDGPDAAEWDVSDSDNESNKDGDGETNPKVPGSGKDDTHSGIVWIGFIPLKWPEHPVEAFTWAMLHGLVAAVFVCWAIGWLKRRRARRERREGYERIVEAEQREQEDQAAARCQQILTDEK